MTDKLPKKIIEMQDIYRNNTLHFWLRNTREDHDVLDFPAIESRGYDRGIEDGYKLHAELTRGLVEDLELVKIQNTCAEYLDECGDSIDGQTCMEAWDSLILEIRSRLDAYKKALEGEE